MSKFTKHDAGKLRFDLIPAEVLEALARAYTVGAHEHGDGNWQRCDNPDRYYAAAHRHLIAERLGEAIDAPSGNFHLDHALASLTMYHYLKYLSRKPGGKKGVPRGPYKKRVTKTQTMTLKTKPMFEGEPVVLETITLPKGYEVNKEALDEPEFGTVYRPHRKVKLRETQLEIPIEEPKKRRRKSKI